MTHQKQTDTHMHGHFWLSRKKLPKTRFRYEIRAHRTRIVRIRVRIVTQYVHTEQSKHIRYIRIVRVGIKKKKPHEKIKR